MRLLRRQRQRMRCGAGWGTLVVALLVIAVTPTLDLLAPDPDESFPGLGFCNIDDDDDLTPIVSDALRCPFAVFGADADGLATGSFLNSCVSTPVLSLTSVLRC